MSIKLTVTFSGNPEDPLTTLGEFREATAAFPDSAVILATFDERYEMFDGLAVEKTREAN